MMNNPRYRREFSNKFDQKQDVPDKLPGVLGTQSGVVSTGYNNLVYVRVNDVPLMAICESVPQVRDLPVWVGYDILDPSTLRVLKIRMIGTSTEGSLNVTGRHATTHQLFGVDPLWVDLRQMLPLLPYASETAMLLNIMPWVVPILGVPTLIGTENADNTYTAASLDLMDYMVETTGKAKYMLVTINTSGVLVATEGSEVDITALALTDVPAVPASTAYVICAVRMYYGQTEIVQHVDNSDILDLRWWAWHSHDGSTLGLAIDGLTDVTITNVADGEVIQSASGVFINRTLAEAGISATDHDHDADYAPISHISDTNNPHSVTAEQLGFDDGPITNTQLHEHVYQEDHTASCNGVKTQFITAQEYQPQNIQVYLNGLLQRPAVAYTEDSTHDAISIITAPTTGDELIVEYITA